MLVLMVPMGFVLKHTILGDYIMADVNDRDAAIVGDNEDLDS